MVGETFNDIRYASAQRQAAAQQAQAQLISIQNINAAKAEAERHVEKGLFTTVPSSVGGMTIGRTNQIGFNAPSISAMRSLTPGSAVQRAMSPSLQANNVFKQGILSGNANPVTYSQVNAVALAQSQATQAANNANRALALSNARNLGTSSSGKKIVL